MPAKATPNPPAKAPLSNVLPGTVVLAGALPVKPIITAPPKKEDIAGTLAKAPLPRTVFEKISIPDPPPTKIPIVPPGLAAIANGRDHVETPEFAFVTNHKPQTARKNYCLTGHCFGIRPLKVGNRLLWPVAEIAKLLNGGQ